MITDFKIFEEYRLSDNVRIIGSGLTYDTNNEYFDNFLNFITFNIYKNGKKLRYEIEWNHNNNHDLIKRLKDRTSVKNSDELKNLIKKLLNELFIDFYQEIINNGSYSLWLSEYNISIIVNINHKYKKIMFVTFLNGIISNNVTNTIELKSTL